MSKAVPKIKNRIKELRQVKASTLRPHPKNYRKHPERQRKLLSQLFGEIGYADALLARELPDGSLQLIDGHLRADLTPDQEVPVLVLDVTEQEANKLLLTLDPLAGLAETDTGLLRELLSITQTSGELAQWLDERIAPVLLDAPEVPKDERSGSSPWDRVNTSDGSRFLIGLCEATIPIALAQKFERGVDACKDAYPTYREAVIATLEACLAHLDP